MTVSFPAFKATCLLVDHAMTFEWGTKYLYLVPAEVTRDKWEAYAEACKACGVPYQKVPEALRFFVTIAYRARNENGAPSIFDAMPWSLETMPGVPPVSAIHRPNMSRKFRTLQVQVENLREYHERASLYDRRTRHGGLSISDLQSRRLNELTRDPFIVKWR